jgi:hypothetical protein
LKSALLKIFVNILAFRLPIALRKLIFPVIQPINDIFIRRELVRDKVRVEGAFKIVLLKDYLWFPLESLGI